VTDPTRREFLRWGTAVTLVGGSGLVGEVLAACGSTTSGPSGETTWQRVLRTKTVNVGVSNDNPQAYIQGTKLVGQVPDVLQATLVAQYGISTVVATVAEFGSMIPGLIAKRFDVIGAGMLIKPARCKQVAFSNPDSDHPDYAVVHKGNPLGVHNFADVGRLNVRIAVTSGTAEQQYAVTAGASGSNLIVVPTDADQLAQLLSNRADLVLTFKPQAHRWVTDNPNALEIAQPFTLLDPSTGKPYPNFAALAVRKEDTDFIAAYNQALSKIIADGTLAQIDNKYDFDLPGPNAPTVEELCKG